MIAGLLLGFLASCALIPFGLLLYDYVDFNKEWIVTVCLIIFALGTTILGGFIGMQLDIVDYNKKIANWQNTKPTMEQALKDKDISDLEKINLITTINEYNMQLTELKEDVKQWWYFYLDDSKVNSLDIIKIN